ncbi:hypothetical protein OIDMADRAFT_26318 [Oidiodendron maius Zn]|uniref:Uncharacterized protein n=1 Tax=Oidiodendron maius (strain Zn) TaxID=913774 RepID=A0A0C3DNN8_OIDMZ|nr:hypothetical protein OIDMADRAFT_26318 [Oidiodendron maius Zn]
MPRSDHHCPERNGTVGNGPNATSAGGCRGERSPIPHCAKHQKYCIPHNRAYMKFKNNGGNGNSGKKKKVSGQKLKAKAVVLFFRKPHKLDFQTTQTQRVPISVLIILTMPRPDPLELILAKSRTHPRKLKEKDKTRRQKATDQAENIFRKKSQK